MTRAVRRSEEPAVAADAVAARTRAAPDATAGPRRSDGDTPALDSGESWQPFMDEALVLARQAAELGEVPVGAVVVRDGVVIATGFNERETAADPTAHAELLAMRRAAEAIGTWRLDGCTVVVTLEPCPMCAGALVNARVERVVFGAADPKAGAVGTLMSIPTDRRLNHRLEVVSGVRADEAAVLLREFFAARRRPRSGA